MQHRINKFIGSHAITTLLIAPIVGFLVAFFALHLHFIVAAFSGMVCSWVVNLLMLLQFQAEMKREQKLGL